MAERQKAPASRSKKEYSFEIVDQCEGLYIQEEKTFEEISKLTKVPAVTLQRWGSEKKNPDGTIEPSWGEKKKQWKSRLLKAQEETRALIREEILLRDLVNQKNLLDKYLEGREYDRSDFNTHSLYRDTLNGIAKLLADMRKRDESLRGIQKIDRPQVFVDFLKDLVSYLKDHDPEALAAMEKNFDPFIQFAKGKYS